VFEQGLGTLIVARGATISEFAVGSSLLDAE
jgi:hypothetical protein